MLVTKKHGIIVLNLRLCVGDMEFLLFVRLCVGDMEFLLFVRLCVMELFVRLCDGIVCETVYW